MIVIINLVMHKTDYLIEQSIDVFDSRRFDQTKKLNELKKRLAQLQIDGCLWLIDNKEPIDCYNYLAKQKIYYRSFAISPNEIRVFISYI